MKAVTTVAVLAMLLAGAGCEKDENPEAQARTPHVSLHIAALTTISLAATALMGLIFGDLAELNPSAGGKMLFDFRQRLCFSSHLGGVRGGCQDCPCRL